VPEKFIENAGLNPWELKPWVLTYVLGRRSN
jgi:hypothetical protein